MLAMFKDDNGVSFECTASDGQFGNIEIKMSKKFPSLFRLTLVDDCTYIYMESACDVVRFLAHWFPDFTKEIEWGTAYDALYALKFQS